MLCNIYCGVFCVCRKEWNNEATYKLDRLPLMDRNQAQALGAVETNEPEQTGNKIKRGILL